MTEKKQDKITDMQVALRQAEKLSYESKQCFSNLRKEMEDLDSAYRGVEASKIKHQFLEELERAEKQMTEDVDNLKEYFEKAYKKQVEEDTNGDTI